MKLEIDAFTGEATAREFTPEELEQIEIDRQRAEKEAEEAAEKAARRAEILERLGLTEDEAKLILG